MMQFKNYILHLSIFKESSTATKFHTDFNASAKTSNDKSLNDEMFTASKLQMDVVVVLFNFSQQILVKYINRCMYILIIASTKLLVVIHKVLLNSCIVLWTGV